MDPGETGTLGNCHGLYHRISANLAVVCSTLLTRAFDETAGLLSRCGIIGVLPQRDAVLD